MSSKIFKSFLDIDANLYSNQYLHITIYRNILLFSLIEIPNSFHNVTLIFTETSIVKLNNANDALRRL